MSYSYCQPSFSPVSREACSQVVVLESCGLLACEVETESEFGLLALWDANRKRMFRRKMRFEKVSFEKKLLPIRENATISVPT